MSHVLEVRTQIRLSKEEILILEIDLSEKNGGSKKDNLHYIWDI
jgi:hypothetical protein